jgi:hypothetical protein
MTICPNPETWNKVFKQLEAFAMSHACVPPTPPEPLILAGWAYSNDIEKSDRWNQMVSWATFNGCLELTTVPEADFYSAAEPAIYQIGPLGGPMYREWDYEPKDRPSVADLTTHLKRLQTEWESVVGNEVGSATHPLAFAGAKGRRLLVQADPTTRPPWGNWTSLSEVEAERRNFTECRKAINRAIRPHEVDHIDFVFSPDSMVVT